MKKITISTLNKALKVGTLPVVLDRVGNGYAWRLPKAITGAGGPDHTVGMSHVYLCNWGRGSKKMEARFDLARRYLAQVSADSKVAYINLRWAMKLPNWGRFGALPELAQAMVRAGIITE